MILDNALIINENRRWHGYVAIEGDTIAEVGSGRYTGNDPHVINLGGKLLMPGVIDTHVHFREPGLTAKGDIASESRAAAAGGVTSYFDMPNCKPPTVTVEAWQQKMKIAQTESAVNYAFYIGASPDNIDHLRSADYHHVPGIKAFLGQSTGSMQVSAEALDAIFSEPRIVSIHSEDQSIIDTNSEEARLKYGAEEVPVTEHPEIRSVEACVKCTREALERASRCGTRLHVLHVSTEEELEFFGTGVPIEDKRITAEACVAHLWFDERDYRTLGTKIKCNPSVKNIRHREALRRAVADGTIDVVSTDHAPHLPADKKGGALSAASGMPSLQFSLQAMIELSRQGCFPLERVVATMCHNPARLFGIERRGFIRKGYKADLVAVDMDQPMTVTPDVIKSKCGWSPFEGTTFSSSIAQVWVNGANPSPENSTPLTFK